MAVLHSRRAATQPPTMVSGSHTVARNDGKRIGAFSTLSHKGCDLSRYRLAPTSVFVGGTAAEPGFPQRIGPVGQELPAMPSCTRFAIFVVVFGSAGYLIVFALAELVASEQREIRTNVGLRSRPAENAPARVSSTMPAGETVSFYQSLQALPLSGR